MSPHHTPPPNSLPATANAVAQDTRRSVLAWSAWRRVALVLPVLALLWLAVVWASVEGAPL